MRRTLLLLAGLLMGFAPAPLPKQCHADSQRELQAMQGVWAERFADSAAATIIGDRMEYSPNYTWKLMLYTKANPKRVTATGVGSEVAGETRQGIYRLEGEKLTICWRRNSVSKLEWPVSDAPIHKDFWIEVFTRVKK
jgi:uncharacterized protein (TIGR03067 family)